MTPARDCPRVLLDVSPITARTEGRTGLARVALSLGLALAARSDLAINTCAWGSLVASEDFEHVRKEFPAIEGLPSQASDWTRFCTRRLRGAAEQIPPVRAFWRIASQATNRLRNPLAGINERAFDLVHSTYARFPRVVRRARRPALLTVHDVMPLRLPATMLPAGQVGITRRILRSIRRDDWVACVSEWTRRDFLEAVGHPPEKAVVIPNGTDHAMFHPHTSRAEVVEVRERYGLSEQPYLLTLSSLAPHKNMRFLIEAWIRSSAASAGGLLVMAGGRTADVNAIMKALGIDAPPRGIVLTGFVSDEDFRRLASGCQSFLFPSLYEGFGLPVLEAMACGAPVVASNRTSIPEVVGNAGRLVDPADCDAWADAMRSTVTNAVRTVPDPDSVRQSQRFSWADAASQYASLYRRILA